MNKILFLRSLSLLFMASLFVPVQVAQSDSKFLSPVSATVVDSSYAGSLSVETSPGESQQINLYRYVHRATPTGQSLLADYDTLARKANQGDGVAARMLFFRLSRCHLSFGNRQAYENAIANAANGGSNVIPQRAQGREEEAYIESLARAEYIEFTNERFTECEGISDRRIWEASHWLDLATRAGDYEAVKVLARMVGREDPRVFPLYEKLWRAGWLPVAETIAAYYLKGMTTQDGQAQPDLIKAYAYAAAYFNVQDAVYAEANHPSTDYLMSLHRDALEAISSKLTEAERRQASSLTATLLRENPNCCVATWPEF